MQDRQVFQLFKGEDVRYRVPIYQRHYVWDETHWQHIWHDIAEKTNSILEATEFVQPVPHFTGVIVTRENANGEVEVVDGQQRLTTFQIILCAIRDICKEKFSGDKDSKKILKNVNHLLNNPEHPDHPTNPDNMYKLLPTEGPDRDAFRYLVDGMLDDSSGLILKAYNIFKGKIETYVFEESVKDPYKRIAALSQTLLFYFKIVQKKLDPNDQAAKIFESLNGRGLSLTQFDLLRNNVFLRASNARNKLYAKHWRHFNNESIWFSDEIVDDFLNNFLQAKLNYKYERERSLFDLYQRDYISNLRRELLIGMDHEDDPKLVESEFKELQRYSSSYAEIANCSEESPVWFYQFLKTDLLKITSWHPLILFLKAELELSEENVKEIFRILESYIVRQFLCFPEIPEWIREHKYRGLRLNIVDRIRRDNSSFKVVLNGILDVLKKQKKEWQWPNDEKVNDSLHAVGNHWSKPLQKYILFRFEREMTDPVLTDYELIWSPELSTEHVMPRGWENAIDASDKKLWPITSGEEYYKKARTRDQYVESIGNLTLLTGDANEMVATESFSNKKKFYKEHSRLSLTNDIISQNNWDVDQIGERAQKLVTLFCQIWLSADKC